MSLPRLAYHSLASDGGDGTCPACGRLVAQAYCGHCGERRRDPDALSLRHLAADAVEHVASLDVKLVRTLALLATRPGFLLVEYRRGVRARYTRPLGLFLIVTVAFVVLGARFNVSLYDVAYAVSEARPTSALGVRRDAVARRTGETRAQLGRRAQEETAEPQRLLLVVFVPCIAIALLIGYAGRQVYVQEHLVLAVHLGAGMLLYLVAMAATASAAGVLLHAAGVRASAVATQRAIAALVAAWLAAVAWFVYATLRRAHGDRPVPALLRTGLVVLSFYLGNAMYHRLLIWVVMRRL